MATSRPQSTPSANEPHWGRRLRGAAAARADTPPAGIAPAVPAPALARPSESASASAAPAATTGHEALGRHHDRAGRWASAEIAATGCAVIAAAFVLLDPECMHWFVLPIYLCGCIVGADAVDWLRQRRGLLDPVGLVGLLGVHFFFLAPLLQIVWGYSVAYVIPPDDWRPWLGWMGCINVVGLCLYRFVVAAVEHRPLRGTATAWTLRSHWFWPVAAVGLVGSALLQASVYLLYGGVAGYVAAYSRFDREDFQGMGILIMLAECFPLLAMLAYGVYARTTGRARSWWFILAAIVAFFVLRVYFGGLRGSRAAYVWPLFWMTGVIHLWVRPIPRAFVLGAALALVAFMYAYGLYKAYGEDITRVMGRQDIEDLTRARNRGLDTTVLTDLGRADIQSFMLWRLWAPAARGGYDYAYGRTYLGAVALVVPSRVWPDRPPGKVKEATELMYGPGTWNTRHPPASQGYGLAGESMLNFGPAAVPVAYAGFGAFVAWVSRWRRQLAREDSRNLLLPFVVSLCPFVLLWDSDVVFVYLVAQGLIPFLLVRVSSRVAPAARGAPPPAGP